MGSTSLRTLRTCGFEALHAAVQLEDCALDEVGAVVDGLHDLHGVMDALSERHEEHGARRVAIGQVSVLGVAHDADDLVGAAGLGHVETEVGADGIFAGFEEIMDEGFVDDGDVLG